MSTGPTDVELHRLWQALVRVQTLAVEPPTSSNREAYQDGLAAAYDLDNVYAVMGMAEYAASRFSMLREIAANHPLLGGGVLAFPRDQLVTARPDGASVPLHRACVGLVETAAAGEDLDRPVRELVEADGPNALRLLSALCVELGRMLVDADPRLASLQQLVAEEASANP